MFSDDPFSEATPEPEPAETQAPASEPATEWKPGESPATGSESPRPTSSLRCPVCRARQPLQPTCRRCQADLRLLVAALREVERLQARHAQALAQGDQETAAQAARQLQELQG